MLGVIKTILTPGHFLTTKTVDQDASTRIRIMGQAPAPCVWIDEAISRFVGFSLEKVVE
jgi:hypothetical protein